MAKTTVSGPEKPVHDAVVDTYTTTLSEFFQWVGNVIQEGQAKQMTNKKRMTKWNGIQ